MDSVKVGCARTISLPVSFGCWPFARTSENTLISLVPLLANFLLRSRQHGAIGLFYLQTAIPLPLLIWMCVYWSNYFLIVFDTLSTSPSIFRCYLLNTLNMLVEWQIKPHCLFYPSALELSSPKLCNVSLVVSWGTTRPLMIKKIALLKMICFLSKHFQLPFVCHLSGILPSWIRTLYGI